MMVGTDIRLMTPIMKELLLNDEAIAINQDYEAIPGDVEKGCDGSEQEVWVRRLTNGDFAIALPNWGDADEEMSFCLETIQWPHGAQAQARNVWAKKDLGLVDKKFSATVASHDTLLLRISPAASVVEA